MTLRTFNQPVKAAPPVTAFRYNPGHYSSMQRRPDQRPQSVMTAATVAGITKGFLKRYSWAALETSAGVYNFTEIASDLDYCLARGLHLIVMFEDRTYGGQYGSDNPAPAYMADYAAVNLDGGYTVAKWDPTVVTRFRALLSAFAAGYGTHAALEGVLQEETALGLAAPALDSDLVNTPYVPYTPQAFRDALIGHVDHWTSVCPSARWFFYMNFIARDPGNYCNEVVVATKPRIVICGPDAEEQNPSLSNVFNIYRNHKATCPVMAHLSTQVYQQAIPPTGEEMFQFATVELGANYICSIFEGATSATWVNRIKPMMTAHPTFNPESW